jgi:hypothetical protein
MSEKKNDANFIGWVDEPKFAADGSLISWQIKFKKADLKNLEKFATPINEKGQGGNIFCQLNMSKAGKPYGTVWDPNSRQSQEKYQAKQAVAQNDDLPF